MVEVSPEAFLSDSFLTETPQRDFLSESIDPVKAAEGSGLCSGAAPQK